MVPLSAATATVERRSFLWRARQFFRCDRRFVAHAAPTISQHSWKSANDSLRIQGRQLRSTRAISPGISIDPPHRICDSDRHRLPNRYTSDAELDPCSDQPQAPPSAVDQSNAPSKLNYIVPRIRWFGSAAPLRDASARRIGTCTLVRQDLNCDETTNGDA